MRAHDLMMVLSLPLVQVGLAGMGGPPLMVLYTALNVPKEIVRGSNAWCNMIQV